jgi:hypothetical protein
MNDKIHTVGRINFAERPPWLPDPGLESPAIERRRGPQPATDDQLDAVAEGYAEIMRARGHAIGGPEIVAIRRMATIQDAWRVAFAKVFG